MGETMKPRVVDNDINEITVTLDGKEIRGWSYVDEPERRVKMLTAREFVEGWFQAGKQSSSIRAEAIEEVLALLTAHELYRYRPKAFHGFIDHCRTELLETNRRASPPDAGVGVKALDEAWKQINALGGRPDGLVGEGMAYNDAIGDALEVIEALGGMDPLRREASPPDAGGWWFCPECGSTEIHHSEGAHKQCADCSQEWFSDIDYTDVTQLNLRRLSSATTPDASGVREALDAIRLEARRREALPLPSAPKDTQRGVALSSAALLARIERMAQAALKGGE